MRVIILPILSLLALTACTKPKPAEPTPPQVMSDTFKGCTWQEIRGKTLAIHAYSCGPEMGEAHMVADDTIGGFGLVGAGGDPDTYVYTPVIRTFTKSADAKIDAVLPQVRLASPGPDTATCTLVPAQDPTAENSTRQLYELAPTGDAKTRWDRNVQSGDDPTPPCGPLGPSFAGSRLFEVLPGDATRVIYIDFGSEIQIFDTTTLKPL